jgi:hypothetical protein
MVTEDAAPGPDWLEAVARVTFDDRAGPRVPGAGTALAG